MLLALAVGAAHPPSTDPPTRFCFQLQNPWIGVVSGKAIFGPPLDDYWKKKLQEEAAAKESVAQKRSPLAVRRPDRDRRSRLPLAVLGAARPHCRCFFLLFLISKVFVFQFYLSTDSQNAIWVLVSSQFY
ncbi:hypothetical protein LWI29_035981 [Acer saccharum]|uniref:Uncharacterized protein n=1 Tax=Acer saccharum TaxID=4024 RepID=A0AA39RLP9_ACESA|nr:hypothetical protein LWI29_035981 [Acer saccharum]